MKNSKQMLFVMLGLASAAATNAAQAQDALPVLDKASFSVGFVIPTFDTDLQANGVLDNGTNVDLERDLGLEQSGGVAFVRGTWRPFENHEFSLGYFSTDSDATRKLTKDIDFEGETYPVNSTVKASFGIDAIDFSYTWWGMRKEDWALGLRLGLVDYSIDTKLSLELDSAGNDVGGSLSGSVSPHLPAPTIGGSWRMRVSDQWRLKAEAGFFNADIDGVDGSVTYFNAGVEWFPWERWGLTANYMYQSIDVAVDKSNFNGNVDQNSGIVSLGLTYRF